MDNYLLSSEYRGTLKGLLGLFNYRRQFKHKRLKFDLEPRRDIYTAVNVREKIVRAKEKYSWRKVNSDIYMEILFEVSERNQTSLYKLTKFFVDLMHKGDVECDALKSLLFTDDKQIKALDVRLTKGNSPSVFVDFSSISTLKEELQLVSYAIDHYHIDENCWNTLTIEDSIDYTWYLKNGVITQEQYTELDKLNQRERRGKLLQIINISNKQEISSLLRYLNGDSTIMDIPITNYFFGRRIAFVPTSEGEGKIYKKELEAQIKTFWSEIGQGGPIDYPIDLNLYYIPPTINGRDIDNYGKEILSISSRIFEFTTDFKFSGYRIITLPKNPTYPNGLLSFTFGMGGQTLSSDMYELLDKLRAEV